MSSARLSVTVPEALWREVCPAGASPSKVVTEALRESLARRWQRVDQMIVDFWSPSDA